MTNTVDKSNLSTFVTVLGWLTITLAGLNILTLLSQLALISKFELPETQGTFAYLIIAGLALLSIAVFAAGVGLVKRLNWARLLLLGFFALTIIGQLIGLYSMMEFSADFSEAPETDDDFVRVQNTFSMIMYLFTTGIIGFSAFCIYKLSSQEVRDEFSA